MKNTKRMPHFCLRHPLGAIILYKFISLSSYNQEVVLFTFLYDKVFAGNEI